MKRKVVISLLCVLLGFCGSLFIPLPRSDFRKAGVQSLKVLDRRGVVLREFLNDDQGRGQWQPLSQIAPMAMQASIAIEDRRFWRHPGVDLLSIARAMVDNLSAGSFRSGGSTISQQVIRNVYHYPRTVLNKLLELWLALRLERMMSKKDILEQYLNRAPYGNQLYGIEAAARSYFGKPARDLSLAESAFLAALPNAPTILNPYQNADGARSRQQLVLKRMLDQEMISEEDFERAQQQPIAIIPRQAQFRAPHAVEQVKQGLGAAANIAAVRTTLDYALQEQVTWIVRGHLATLAKKNVTNASVVVVENRSRAIRALVGSVDYFNERVSGQVNGALARRQPGSSIKPFLYGIALEGQFTPATILADIPTHIPDQQGDYIPENYDRQYHGPVRLRTSLACSYNIPAVRLLQAIGVETFLQRLHAAGFASLTEPASYYGYGLTLGNGEITLLELTNAYATLANGGVWQPLRLLDSVQTVDGQMLDPPINIPTSIPGHRVFDIRAAYLLMDILSDPVARRLAFGSAFRFPFQCAVKTGTTKDYRDNWTMGFTTAYTVGVWVGNFDGSPMRGVSGITGAGQIFSDIMMVLHEHAPPPGFSLPSGLLRRAVCPRSGNIPTQACGRTILEWFKQGHEPTEQCSVHKQYHVVEKGREHVRVYEVMPPEFRVWAEEERIPAPPPEATQVYPVESRSRQKSATSEVRPLILYPSNGDQFKIDPALKPEYQSIKIIGVSPEQSSQVMLRINDDVIAFNPSGTWWTLRRGRHTFRLEAIVGRIRGFSDPVAIQVE